MTFQFIGEEIPEGADRAWFDRFRFENPYSGASKFTQSEWAIDREHGIFCTALGGPGNKIPEERPSFYVLGFKDGTVIRLELFDYYEIFRKESELGMHTHYVERAYVPAGVSYSDDDLHEMIEKGWMTFRNYETKRDYHLVFADDCIKRRQEVVETEVAIKIAGIVDDLTNWRKNTGIPEGQALSTIQRNKLISFTYECFDRMGYDLPAYRRNATVIPHTGKVKVDGVMINSWEMVSVITKQSPEKYMYLFDTPVGKLMTSVLFKEALKIAAGSEEVAERIASGQFNQQ